MSLILEALKKVERERATPEQRGFLVLGPAAWTPSRSNVGMIGGMVAAAVIAGGAVYLLTRPDAAAAPSVARVDERVAPPEPIAPPTSAWVPPPASSVARPRASTTPPPARAIVLNAISAQDGVPIAVLNDRVVREGDTFDGIRVRRIRPTEVEVEIDGARRTLRF